MLRKSDASGAGLPARGFLVGLDLSSTARDKLEAGAEDSTAERLAVRLSETAQVLGPGPIWRNGAVMPAD